MEKPISLGKLLYFLNLNYSGIWGTLPLLYHHHLREFPTHSCPAHMGNAYKLQKACRSLKQRDVGLTCFNPKKTTSKNKKIWPRWFKPWPFLGWWVHVTRNQGVTTWPPTIGDEKGHGLTHLVSVCVFWHKTRPLGPAWGISNMVQSVTFHGIFL